MKTDILYNFFQSLTPTLLIFLIFFAIIISLQLMFFIKIWNMTNDVDSIKKILERDSVERASSTNSSRNNQ